MINLGFTGHGVGKLLVSMARSQPRKQVPKDQQPAQGAPRGRHDVTLRRVRDALPLPENLASRLVSRIAYD